MSLLSSSKISRNELLQDRVVSAIRKLAETHLSDSDKSASNLANAAYTDPSVYLNHFMIRVSTNGSVSEKACESCGHSPVDDATIEWIVNDCWNKIAKDLFPTEADRNVNGQ